MSKEFETKQIDIDFEARLFFKNLFLKTLAFITVEDFNSNQLSLDLKDIYQKLPGGSEKIDLFENYLGDKLNQQSSKNVDSNLDKYLKMRYFQINSEKTIDNFDSTQSSQNEVNLSNIADYQDLKQITIIDKTLSESLIKSSQLFSKLIRIDLENNQLKHIPSIVFMNNSIQYLGIRKNPIKVFDSAKNIRIFTEKLPNLKSLNSRACH